MTLARFLPFLACAAVSAGCGFHVGASTSGSAGRAQFSFVSGDGCLLGCTVDHPLMLGTAEKIEVEADGGLPAVFPVSSDAAVLSVDSIAHTCCSGSSSHAACRTGDANLACAAGEELRLTVEVHALGTGTSSLVLHTMNGDQYDGVPLRVSAPSRLAASCMMGSVVQTASVELAVGQTCAVGWSAFDASGEALQASQGVELHVTDPSVAAFAEVVGSPTGSTAGEESLLVSPTLVGMARGATRLVVSAAGALGTMSVDVR